jgi:hypothetical protein
MLWRHFVLTAYDISASLISEEKLKRRKMGTQAVCETIYLIAASHRTVRAIPWTQAGTQMMIDHKVS